MQYNNKIVITFNTYDDFAQTTEASRNEISCRVLANRKKATDTAKTKSKSYDLKIVTSNKAFAPYNQVCADDTVIFEYEGRKFRPMMIAGINDFSGKTRCYEIELEQVT